jgi:integrase
MPQQRPRIKLTERSVARLPAPDPSGKQIIHWDSDLRGFGVMCSATSNVKTFLAKGTIRDHNGRSIRAPRTTIGRYPVLSVEQARIRANAILRGFMGGIDPRAERSSDVTLREAMEGFLRARAGNLRPKSVKGYRDDVERHLAIWLDKPLRNVNRDMIEGRHRAIAEEIAERSGLSGAAMANRVMRSLRAIYNFHLDRVPNLPPNPVKLRGMWHDVQPRVRCLRGSEFRKFYKAASELPNKVGADFVRLLLFTGLRRTEAAKIRWSDVDLDHKTLTIPPENAKNGKRLTLPLTDVIFKLLKERQSLGRTEYVFFGNGAAGHLQEPKSFFADIAAASGVQISPHDLRRSYITTAESCDIPLLALAALVNHAVPGVTSSYVQMNVERLRKPAQKVADRLKELCGIGR